MKQVSQWWGPCGADSRKRAAKKLHERGVEYLYHFTAEQNLQGIQDAKAICSKETLKRMGQSLDEVPGGNRLSRNLDEVWNNGGFVSLSFSRYTPQFYKKREQRPLVIFCISPRVAGAEGACFTNTNATSKDQKRVGLDQALSRLNFWSDPQSEVLVPDHIPLRGFVEEIVVESEAQRARVVTVFSRRFRIAVAPTPAARSPVSIHLKDDTEDTVGVSHPGHSASERDRAPEVRPRRYDTPCWKCGQALSSTENDKCPECGWLVCECGACRAHQFEGCSRPQHRAVAAAESAGELPWRPLAPDDG